MTDAPPPAPAGWYPHPDMADTVRYWDGSAWTGQVAPQSSPPSSEPAAETAPCGYCRKPITLGSTRCPHCGGEYLFCKKHKMPMPYVTRSKFVGVLRGGTKDAHYCRSCGTHVGGVRF